ncbi:MAG: asparagine synthase (glutamine-hydrolyzing) [Candidatus Improbicoccus pseudotrichonymphae]|uniref:asparagine synthase (glutamine-hydrolyzing) n=1 Tax=Candidatus Improbicoccus pseudotrichonymphae TaxID=3033792 RepID=A0AA48I4M2_9FIRM|nr:MAG: asparagine synthase (glutamine-hydrolyzing) [Candidatus Improbicoccus pseudotrichonymphae]
MAMDMADKKTVIKNMTDIISHRGPDDVGYYISNDIVFGFRRLSIIDLKTGGQPIYNEDKTLVLVFNGEIYNHESIRNELVDLNHIFKSNTDSEVIIHAFEEWGEFCLERFRGMFAFSIWNTNDNSLFIARDFFGIKPLYYYLSSDKNIVYASEIKSILLYPNFLKEFNEKALDNYLSFQYAPGNETFFKNVYSLDAGSFIFFKNNEIRIKKYFNPCFKPKNTLNLNDAAKKTRDAIDDSVKFHSVSDVEVGCFLSGGIDSSLLASYFPGHKSFTVGFGETGHYSEIFKAKKISEKIGIENFSKIISEDEYWDNIERVQYFMDQPLADPSCVALYFVCKLASEHVKVVMSGEGADELFAGYPVYNRPRVFKLYQKIFPQNIRTFLANLVRKLPIRFKGCGFILRGENIIEDSFIGNASIFSGEEKNRILNDDYHQNATNPSCFVQKFYEKVENLDSITKMQYLDINLWLVGDILLKADRMSMANSLELRVPYLDRKVFEIASEIPSKLKTNRKNTKCVLRASAADKIPDFTVKEKKLGFPIPIRIWLRKKKYYERVKSAFESDISAKFFNVKNICDILLEHYDGKCDNSRKIWVVYIFIVWYNIYFDKDNINFKI